MCDFGYITVFRSGFDFTGIIGLACPGIMVLSLISSMRSSNLPLIFESFDLFMISLHLGMWIGSPFLSFLVWSNKNSS